MVRKYAPLILTVVVLCLFTTAEAWASAGTGGKLPYEDWLTSVRNSATGQIGRAHV